MIGNRRFKSDLYGNQFFEKLSQRDAHPLTYRKERVQLFFVAETGLTYRLEGGITNDKFVPYAKGMTGPSPDDVMSQKAVSEVVGAVRQVPQGVQGQIVGFDANGNPVAQEDAGGTGVFAPVADLVELKAIDTTLAADWPDKWAIYVESLRIFYALDRESTALDDGDTVIAPTVGTGRWLRRVIALATTNKEGLMSAPDKDFIEKEKNLSAKSADVLDSDANSSTAQAYGLALDADRAIITVKTNSRITLSGGVEKKIYEVHLIQGAGAPHNVEFANLRGTDNVFSTAGNNRDILFIKKVGVSYLLVDMLTLHAPVITLKGNNPDVVQLGGVYADPGSTADDMEDGDISANISRVDSVNETIAGWYTVTHDVTDSDQVPAVQKVRDVKVNTTPVVKTAIADQSQAVGFTSYTIELATVGAEVFSDPDGDAMTYSATSSNTALVTVSVSGSRLTVTAADSVTTGTANITVTANDGWGGAVNDVFVHTTV